MHIILSLGKIGFCSPTVFHEMHTKTYTNLLSPLATSGLLGHNSLLSRVDITVSGTVTTKTQTSYHDMVLIVDISIKLGNRH